MILRKTKIEELDSLPVAELTQDQSEQVLAITDATEQFEELICRGLNNVGGNSESGLPWTRQTLKAEMGRGAQFTCYRAIMGLTGLKDAEAKTPGEAPAKPLST